MFKAGDDHNDRYYCSCGSVQSLWIQRNTTSKHLKLGRHWVSSPISAIKAMNILSAFDSNKEKNAIELNGFYDYVLYTHTETIGWRLSMCLMSGRITCECITTDQCCRGLAIDSDDLTIRVRNMPTHSNNG